MTTNYKRRSVKGFGREMKFPDVEVLKQKIEDYFLSCYKEVGKGKNKRKVLLEHPTVSGLADFLDTDRITLLRYETLYAEDMPEHSNAIKAAKAKIERYMEQILLSKTVAAGVIFSLKNNFLWRDEKQLEVSGDITIEATITGIKSTVEGS